MTRMLKRFTIGWKILSSLTVLLLLSVGANYMIFVTQKDRISASVFNELALVTNAGKLALLDEIEGIRRRTVDFSSDGFIRDATKEIVTSGDEAIERQLSAHLLKNKLSLDPVIYGINVLDNNGTIIASTDADEIGKDGSKDPYYVQSEDLVYGTAYASDFTPTGHFKIDTVALVITAPLMDKMTGERIGALMNFVAADRIVGVLKDQEGLIAEVGKNGDIAMFIANKEGFIIDKRYIDGARLTKKIDTAKTARCGEKKGYVNFEGVSVIGATLCMNTGWTLVAEIPEAQAMAEIGTMRKNLLYLMTALAILILVMMYLLTRTVIEPIKMLSDSAKKIGEGKFDARTDISSGDELGDLSASFNEMAGKLQESHKMLADRIREVTGNLEKFRLAVEGASDHIIITDKEGVIVYANKAAEDTTGYTRTEMIGKRPSLWGKQMPEEFYRRMWRTIKEDRTSFYGEVANKRKNGQLYIAETHIAPLFDEKGGLYGFVGVERDITRQKEIDKAKTEFVSIASHQLRTPLTIINWYVEMLTTPEEFELSERQRQYLNEITRASRRMIELVNALLNVSRIDMGTFMVDVQPLNFMEVMDDTLKDLMPQITEKNLAITKRYDRSIPSINADPKLLRMVFQNLLTNAVKYTPEGGSITIGLSKEDANILIAVADTGFGIPAHQQDKIFTKFFRADNAREKEPDGNGLGLYIVRSLIEHSGGKIWFVSKEDKGTTFYVSLPMAGMKPKEGTRPLAI